MLIQLVDLPNDKDILMRDVSFLEIGFPLLGGRIFSNAIIKAPFHLNV